jgi:hypothetical protein
VLNVCEPSSAGRDSGSQSYRIPYESL